LAFHFDPVDRPHIFSEQGPIFVNRVMAVIRLLIYLTNAVQWCASDKLVENTYVRHFRLKLRGWYSLFLWRLQKEVHVCDSSAFQCSWCSTNLNFNDILIPVLSHARWSKGMRSFTTHLAVYRVAQKSKPLPIDKKLVLKPVNEIIFIRQIKVWIKHIDIIRCHWIFYAWPTL